MTRFQQYHADIFSLCNSYHFLLEEPDINNYYKVYYYYNDITNIMSIVYKYSIDTFEYQPQKKKFARILDIEFNIKDLNLIINTKIREIKINKLLE